MICGTLKDFLRSLTEPLVTFALHEAFSDAASKFSTASNHYALSFRCMIIVFLMWISQPEPSPK